MKNRGPRVFGYERLYKRFQGERTQLPLISSVTIAYSEKPADYSWPVHFHPSGTEIYYVDRGRLIMTSRGKTFMLKEREVAVFPPRCPHAVRGDPKHPPNILLVKVNSKGLLKVVPEIASLAGRPLQAGEAAVRLLADLYRHVKNGGPNAGRLASIYALGALFSMLGGVSRDARMGGEEVRGGAYGGYTARIEEFIKSRIDNKITLPGLARALGCSVSALCHRYRRLTGETPHRLVLRLRMERARDLLRDPDLPVKRVAREVGFVSVPSFIRAFRRLERVTPGEYRRGALSRI